MARPIAIGVSGAAGRMGRRIVSLAASDPAFRIACALESAGSPELGSDAGQVAGARALGVAIAQRLGKGACEVLIDFSVADAVAGRVDECLRHGVRLVVGTTGLSTATRRRIEHASRRIAVLMAPNMSLGIHLLRRLCEETARALAGHHPDVEIIEAHHSQKRDAPSGTALWLADGVEKGLGRKARRIYGRRGPVGARDPREIALHAVRAGAIAGEHTVLYGLSAERIELVHRAESRDAFARGALAAARFLSRVRRPGLYSMADVLGMSDGPRRKGK